MDSPTRILVDEHTVILRALDLLEAGVSRLEAGTAPPEAWWQNLVAWLRGFADETHHGKEERLLFPAMSRAGGLPCGGDPIAVMLHEHVEGRMLVTAIANGAADAARRARAGHAFAGLLRAHIDKENLILFPMADAALDPPARAALLEAFAAAGTDSGADARLTRLAAALGA